MVICLDKQIYRTKYKINDRIVTGTINNLVVDGNNIKIYIDEILINYYTDDYQELNKYQIGDKIKAIGILNEPKAEDNFYLFNYRHYLLSKQIYYIMDNPDISLISNKVSFNYKAKRYINQKIMSYKSSAYLQTFILGDNSYLNNDIKNSYQVNGVSHLFAVSGMHVSLLTIILAYILKKIIKKDIYRYGIVFSFLLFYAFLTNYSPSIIRATFLFIVCTINKAYNLNIRNDYLLIYIFVVNIFINPFNIYNNGFLFSYLISYALIKFGNIVNNYQNYFLKLFMTSLISFLVSIPIIINSYFSINLLTPFLNLFFVPLISFIVFPLSLLSFAIEPLDNLLFILTSMMEKLSLFMSQIKNFNVTLAHIPFYCLIIYYVVIIFIINKLKIKEYKYIVILLMILFFHHNINYLKEDATIYFINVGQGDSILISLPHNQGNILIDCSNKQQYKTNSWSDTKKNYNVGKNVIEPFLKAQGINKLDYMIITHGDYDHIGSLVYLLKTFPIKHVIFNSGHDNYYETEALKLIKKNKINFSRLNTNILKIDKYSFYFLNNVDKENENEDSLVIYTIINNFKILLMGDAGIPTEKYLLNAYNIINVDILKVGHHGSKYGTSKDFLKRINPKYSIISVGANNKFNHPSKEVINNLAFSNLYLTSINGSIKIVLKPNILVETVR